MSPRGESLLERRCMSDRVFVDTNVFVYSRDASDTRKLGRANQVISFLWEEAGINTMEKDIVVIRG